MKNKFNEIDKSLYSEKSLYLLNIRELRDLGRKFGVPSPTTMKKGDLIDYILKVVYGEIETPVRNSFGRPSVREFDMSKYVDKIKKYSDITDELKTISLEDFGTMKVSSFKDIYEDDNIETRVFCEEDGKFYLKVREFVKSKDDIEISSELVKKFNLEPLDVVEISISEDMFKVISINGIKIKVNFDAIDVCGTKLHAGISRDFYLGTKEEIREEIEKLAANCARNEIKCFIFASKNLTIPSAECVWYSDDEEYSKIYKKLVYFIGLCEKAVLDGGDFVIAIENADDIEEMLACFETDVADRARRFVNASLPKFALLGNALLLFRCESEISY